MTNTLAPRLSILTLLTATVFLVSYQTSIAQAMLNYVLRVAPPFIGRNEVIFALLFVLVGAIIGGIYRVGGKAKTTLLTIVCLPILLFVALPYSLNNWSSDQSNPYLTGGLPFFFTIISGVIIVFCLISINLISKLEDTEKQLSQRGAQKREIQILTAASTTYILPVTGLAMLLSIVALIITLASRPLGAYIVELSPFMTIAIGIATISSTILLIYFVLKRNTQT